MKWFASAIALVAFISFAHANDNLGDLEIFERDKVFSTNTGINQYPYRGRVPDELCDPKSLGEKPSAGYCGIVTIVEQHLTCKFWVDEQTHQIGQKALCLNLNKFHDQVREFRNMTTETNQRMDEIIKFMGL